MLSTAYMALDRAVGACLRDVPLLQRVPLTREIRRNKGGILRDAFRAYRLNKERSAPALEDDPDDEERPILDFWKWLIESGKIQAFMTFLVNEFLPALFAIILQIIESLSAVDVTPVAARIALAFAVDKKKETAPVVTPA